MHGGHGRTQGAAPAAVGRWLLLFAVLFVVLAPHCTGHDADHGADHGADHPPAATTMTLDAGTAGAHDVANCGEHIRSSAEPAVSASNADVVGHDVCPSIVAAPGHHPSNPTGAPDPVGGPPVLTLVCISRT